MFLKLMGKITQNRRKKMGKIAVVVEAIKNLKNNHLDFIVIFSEIIKFKYNGNSFFFD